jgi:hypothetical protein
MDAAITKQTVGLEQLSALAGEQCLAAVLDATDAPEVLDKVAHLGPQRACSLFVGPSEQDYSAFAPYLVRLDVGNLKWLHENLWRQAWGIFVVSRADLPMLQAHLRRFLLVRLPDGKQTYFRYYDPRILAVYAENCTSVEIEHFWGPVSAFGVSTEDDRVVFLKRKPAAGAEPPRFAAPWKIRPEQADAFRHVAIRRFEEDTFIHLHKIFPDDCRVIGGPRLREIIRSGIQRAGTYGITSQRDVCLYIDLQVQFGLDFDTNGSLPWVQAILNEQEEEPSDRIDRVYAMAIALEDEEYAKELQEHPAEEV